MAYFKDSPYAQQKLFPRMVSSVRAPLLPDGYQGNDVGQTSSSISDFIKNPYFIGVVAVIIIIIIWLVMK
jgi:hypothetical protein